MARGYIEFAAEDPVKFVVSDKLVRDFFVDTCLVGEFDVYSRTVLAVNLLETFLVNELTKKSISAAKV